MKKKCPYCGNEIEVKEENIMPEPGKGMVMACKKCNSKSSDESFEVEDIGLAWANTSETCLKYKNRHQFIKDYLSLNKK